MCRVLIIIHFLPYTYPTFILKAVKYHCETQAGEAYHSCYTRGAEEPLHTFMTNLWSVTADEGWWSSTPPDLTVVSPPWDLWNFILCWGPGRIWALLHTNCSLHICSLCSHNNGLNTGNFWGYLREPWIKSWSHHIHFWSGTLMLFLLHQVKNSLFEFRRRTVLFKMYLIVHYFLFILICKVQFNLTIRQKCMGPTNIWINVSYFC